jgi:hypothetical protein
MSVDREIEDTSFGVDSDIAKDSLLKPGPPDDWPNPSWFDPVMSSWWWEKKPDPCPVRALGTVDGEYIFITFFGEIRRFTSAGLHGRGGLADLFGGSLWWPLRHFRKFDFEKQAQVGELQREACIAALMRSCLQAGFYDGSRPHRSVGIWRGPDREPIVHAGNQIFHRQEVVDPGVQIGEALFVIGGEREAPAHTRLKMQATFSWDPASASLGRIVTAHLDEWNWDTTEARDLYQGGLHCDMLCSALSWLPHKFVLAPYGSGKSSLLRYSRALLGGGAHAVQRTYSKAYLEQKFAGTAAAFYLDETESDAEADRIRRVFELVRLLSDDGAEGGRGTSGGKSRTLDVHGTVTMAATVTGEWPPQDRSRITLLELQKLEDRGETRPPAPPETMAAMLEAAAKMSATLRARALATWDLFHKNLKIARAAILEIGGQARDADQLGHLVAGWKTMTSDDPLDDNDQLIRFRPFIMSLVEAEDGEDAASLLLNTLFGLAPDIWRSGERRTIGQLIALGRADETESFECRKALLPNGLRLDKREGETWAQAWLAVANKHAGLDKLLAGYSSYQGPKRSQILGQLRHVVGGIEHKAQRSATPLRFAGVQSRYLLIPPLFLPSLEEE